MVAAKPKPKAAPVLSWPSMEDTRRMPPVSVSTRAGSWLKLLFDGMRRITCDSGSCHAAAHTRGEAGRRQGRGGAGSRQAKHAGGAGGHGCAPRAKAARQGRAKRVCVCLSQLCAILPE